VGVVTISAPYGARGHEVGTAVAQQLGLTLLDRAIPAAVARQLNISDEEAQDLDERAPRLWERLASLFANVGAIGAAGPGPETIQSPDEYRLATESVLRQTADTTGAVVLGRAGMVVLGGRPDVLCVRLDGPVEARIAHMVAHGTDEHGQTSPAGSGSHPRGVRPDLLQCASGRSAALSPHSRHDRIAGGYLYRDHRDGGQGPVPLVRVSTPACVLRAGHKSVDPARAIRVHQLMRWVESVRTV
jgi:hypothetical protein